MFETPKLAYFIVCQTGSPFGFRDFRLIHRPDASNIYAKKKKKKKMKKVQRVEMKKKILKTLDHPSFLCIPYAPRWV